MYQQNVHNSVFIGNPRKVYPNNARIALYLLETTVGCIPNKTHVTRYLLVTTKNKYPIKPTYLLFCWFPNKSNAQQIHKLQILLGIYFIEQYAIGGSHFNPWAQL